MDIREKLADLLRNGRIQRTVCSSDGSPVTSYLCGMVEEDSVGLVADYLLSNGVTVQEQGQWTENQQTTYDSTWGEDVYWYTYTCSVCGGEAMNNFDYCPFCGNPMLPNPPKGE